MYQFKSKFYGGLLALILCSVLPAHAQMTDDQVVTFVKQAMSSGKGETQIGLELQARGVTKNQIKRLKTRYEQQQGSETRRWDLSADQPLRKRVHDDDNLTAGSLDQIDKTVGKPVSKVASGPQIFGHNLFNGRELTFEPNENMATPENYRLGPGDEVIIDIWGANEDNIRQRITPEGDIMVSQIGPVYLNGLTIREADEKIRRDFAQKYGGVSGENPISDIRVTLGQIRSIQINVMGEVSTPGTYRLSSFSTVFHALYQAGGVTPIGSLRNIRVMRNGKQVSELDIYDYLFEGHFSEDIRLEEGDVLIVPAYEQLVYIDGNVKRPMYYEMKKGETLENLINYAGGFTGNAYTDELRLVREAGKEHTLYNIDRNAYGSYVLEDGDTVTAGAVLDRFANRVEVHGAVYREGMYELGENTVRTLIEQAEGLRDDAFLPRALLFREQEDLSPEVIAIDLQGIMEGSAPDIALKRNDMLVVASIHELTDLGTLTIFGEVTRPGEYPYAENITLEDLVIQAGGLSDGASWVNAEVSRRLKAPRSTEPSDRISETFQFSLKDGLVIDGTPGFMLEPFDIVEIRKSPGYQIQRRIEVEGEVVFPGGYTMVRKNERLSDIIKRTGGITVEAYVRGARLLRKMNDEEKARRDDALRMARQNKGADSVVIGNLQLSDWYSVGIELDKALANPGSSYDVILRADDRLIIPEYVSTVKISGDVMYPNTVVYIEGKKLKYYISQAGGYGSRAKKNRAYIIYMNGTVARGTGGVPIQPGCEIVVPSRRARKGMNVMDIFGLATSAASIGTMAASIANLSK